MTLSEATPALFRLACLRVHARSQLERINRGLVQATDEERDALTSAIAEADEILKGTSNHVIGCNP